jgi:hypothetical protein
MLKRSGRPRTRDTIRARTLHLRYRMHDHYLIPGFAQIWCLAVASPHRRYRGMASTYRFPRMKSRDATVWGNSVVNLALHEIVGAQRAEICVKERRHGIACREMGKCTFSYQPQRYQSLETGNYPSGNRMRYGHDAHVPRSRIGEKLPSVDDVKHLDHGAHQESLCVSLIHPSCNYAIDFLLTKFY